MKIKELTDKIFRFIFNRFVELFGLFLIIVSILLLASLITYSPEDPNYIVKSNNDIKNILGYRGSITADFFFQSIGLISFVFVVSIFFTGFNLFKSKNFLLVIENLFFCILYFITGTLFLSIYYPESHWLIFNGNAGFLGDFLLGDFALKIININKTIFYYILILISLLLFLRSINFKLKNSLVILNKIFLIFKQKKLNENTYKDEKVHKEDTVGENVNLIQEDLPFNQNDDRSILLFIPPE